MTAQSGLLKLPMELLQLIAEDCDLATDIFSMRLACKQLAAAAFTPFAREYIANLRCFILDPIRLLRILNIIATPHLCKQIRTVSLTLCALEDHFDPPLAPKEKETQEEAQSTFIDRQASEAYDLHQCAAQGVSKSAWYAIKSVMAHLGRRRDCSIIIDLQSEEGVGDRISRQRPDLATELLTLANDAGCAVSGLLSGNDYDMDDALFTPGGRLPHVLENIKDFAYVFDLVGDEDVQAKTSLQSQRLFEVVGRECRNLQNLDLVVTPKMLKDSPDWGSFSFAIPERIFRGAAMKLLRKIRLIRVDSEEKDLVAMLNRCRASLQDVFLKDVCLKNDAGNQWLDTLSAFSKCTDLNKLFVIYPAIEINGDLKWVELVVDNWGKEDRPTCVACYESGNASIQHFLEMNIKKGLTFKDYA